MISYTNTFKGEKMENKRGMEITKGNIDKIFQKGRSIEIPFFQRSYVWEKESLERFLDDMKFTNDNKQEYFMGAIILKDEPTASTELSKKTLIDGQQRLSTIMLFFKVVCETKKREDLFKEKFYNANEDIILIHNHNDLKVFEAIVNGELTDDIREDYKNNNILKCYDFFKKEEKELKDIEIEELLNNLYFAVIDLKVDEDEQQIFDTINSLGVSLTTAELLKNELFSGQKEDLYGRTWKKTFESDEDIKKFWDEKITSGRQYRVNIDFLLQSYLLIESGAKEKYMTLKSLFNNYKDFLKEGFKDQESFVERLVECAKVYKKNIDSSLLNEAIDKKSAIERLNIVIFGAGITTVVPYILYILETVNDDKEQQKMFSLLENYLIRRLVCKETTKNYNNLFASFIRNKIDSLEKLVEKLYSIDSIDRFPDDKSLKEGFEKNKLYNQQAKTILYLIENSIREDKESTALHPFSGYSLEHIMPKKWRNKWDRGLSDEQERDRDQLLLTLGNLTIITSKLNSSIVDGDWNTKKQGGKNKGGLEKFGKGIKIFDDVLGLDVWDEEEIKKRSDDLCDKAINIWEYKKELSEKYKVKTEPKITYTIDDHTYLSDGEMSELFETLRRRIKNIDTSVSESFTKLYVAYKVDNNFVCIVPIKSQLKLRLGLDAIDISDPKLPCRDISKVGSWGTGNTEVIISSTEQLDDAMELIKQSFENNSTED